MYYIYVSYRHYLSLYFCYLYVIIRAEDNLLIRIKSKYKQLKYDSIMPNLISKEKVHNSWKDFYKKTENLLEKIEGEIGNNYTPKQGVLHFLETDLQNIKVIILGQDPYLQEGVATGRAFEVKGLSNWFSKKINTSLRNIFKAIYYAYKKNKFSISVIEKDESFIILPPDKWFKDMEKQGVLFLNTAFTCEIEKPNSHKEIWQNYTKELIIYIKEKNAKCNWSIWGKNAKDFAEEHEIETKFKSCHPRLNAFIDDTNNGFEETKGLINWLGIA